MSRYTLPCLVVAAIVMALFFTLPPSSIAATARPFLAQRPLSTMSHAPAVVSFKKNATPEAKQKIIDEIKAKGGTIEKDEHMNSSIYPYIVVKVSPEQFSGLNSGLTGDTPVEKIEEEKTFTTQ